MTKSTDRGLPTNVDAERFVLGSILLTGILPPELDGDVFAIEKHRRILKRMRDMAARGDGIDRVTVANELMKFNELESCDGLSYLVSLDDGLPHLPNIDSYLRILRDDATLRKIIFAGQNLQALAMDPGAEPTEILEVARKQFLNLSESLQQSSLHTPTDIIEAAGGLNVYVDRKNRSRGISTGYKGIDLITGGLKPGCLYIVAARPKMGKTALAMNIVERVSVNGDLPSVVFSLEMSEQELLDRMICSRAHVNTQSFAQGYLNAEERRRVGLAAGEIAAGHVLIDDRATMKTDEMHAVIRKQQARHGAVGLVVVDYLQLFLKCKLDERVAMMSQVSRDHKLIAKDCKVPIIALSQLSRACEARGSDNNVDGYRPVASDLRESGAIEADADLVASVFRGEVYVRHRPELLDRWRGLADLEVLLQRNGPTGIIPLVFQHESVRFQERCND